MDRKEAEKVIRDLAQEVNIYFEPDTYISSFLVWRQKAIRRISLVFGPDSPQVKSLEQTEFFKPSSSPFNSLDAFAKLQIPDIVFRFNETLESLLGDLDFLEPTENLKETSLQKPQKIFVSHSSIDNEIGKEVINLLQLIGIKHNQIFYTSAAGYGIPLGKDWVETLKTEVSGEGIVISLLSDNYFNSQICLLEMGATWVLSKLHIPILIPPLNFNSVNEVINTKQGFQISDRLRWSSLKRELERFFEIEPIPEDKWEPQRNSIIERIEKLLSTK